MSFDYIKLASFIFLTAFYLVSITTVGAQDKQLDIFEQARIEQKKITTALDECNEDRAIRVEFDNLFDSRLEPFQANPELIHTCVKFAAIASWRRATKDKHYGYRIAQSGAYRAHTQIRQHIGLTGHEVMRKAGLSDTTKQGDLVGVLSTCGFTMGGYCHYEGGPHLVLKSLSGEEVEQGFRYLGKAAEKEFGNMKPLSMKMVKNIGIDNFFTRWTQAIAKNNRESFDWIAENAGYGSMRHTQYDDHKSAKSVDDIHGFYRGLWEAFFDSESIYRQLETSQQNQRKYFRSTKLMASDGSGLLTSPIDADYFACLCLTNDCSNLWPISSRDAGISASYPYICKMFSKNNDDEWKAYLPSRTGKMNIVEQIYQP